MLNYCFLIYLMKAKWFTLRKQLPNLHLDLWLITLGMPLSWLLQQNCITVKGEFSHVNVTIITIGRFKSRVSGILTSPVPRSNVHMRVFMDKKILLTMTCTLYQAHGDFHSMKILLSHAAQSKMRHDSIVICTLYQDAEHFSHGYGKTRPASFKFMLFFLLLHSYGAYFGLT